MGGWDPKKGYPALLSHDICQQKLGFLTLLDHFRINNAMVAWFGIKGLESSIK
jgi:hypothetical protein